MNDITALAKTLRLAAESEIAHRAEGDTSDLWQDETSPENVLALVEALEKAQEITAAAEKLVRCKGRYHSEQNYRALAALFGVKTPDLPQLESESRTVTVKLPDEGIDQVCLAAAEIHNRGNGVSDDKAQFIINRIRNYLEHGGELKGAGIQVIEGEGQ